MRRPLRTYILAGVIASVLALSLAGCASSPSGVPAQDGPDKEAPQQPSVQNSGMFDTSTLDLEFSERDQDASYDEATATKVALVGESAQVEGVGARAEGGVVTLSQSGTYVISGTLSQGQLVVDAADEDKVQVVLAGASIHNETGPAFYVNNAKKCFLTLASGTDNALSDGAAYALEGEDDNRDAVLFSRDDLTINGDGALAVTGSYQHGICSKDDLIITGGLLTVEAKEDAFQGKDCIKVAEGAFTVNAGDDAFHSDGYVYMQAGTVMVESCYEGYEGEQVIISGGTHSITASDDAVNAALSDSEGTSDAEGSGGAGVGPGRFGGDQMAASSSECLIQINDGILTVSGANDGLDSNGNVQINGGTVLVSGPDAGMDGALDYDLEAQVNGGTVLMTGAVGSTHGLDASQQSVALGQAAGAAEQEVILLSAEGTELVRMTAAQSFSTVLASSPQIDKGQSFFLKVGDETIELTMGTLAATTMKEGQAGPGGGMGADPRSGRRPEAV